MNGKNKLYYQGFTALAMLSLSACAGGGGGGGNGNSTPAEVIIPNQANVYSSVDGETLPTDLENLLVFGDSYSNINRSTFRLWSEIVTVGTRQPETSLETYAVSAATANDDNPYAGHSGNNFKRQVDQWEATNPTFGRGDATVAWFGYNDVNNFEDLSESKADHLTQIDRLIDAGALEGDRRLFVPMLHDWERTPGEQDNGVDKRSRVLDWNQHVADLANSDRGIVAVDLFTVFERIHENPAAFNFTDVSNPHPEDGGFNDYTGNLYIDDYHFTLHGHDVIAEVFNHYMTRGWDWANSLSAGASASAQLEQDIDEGRIDRINKLNAGETQLGFSSYAIGQGRDQLVSNLSDDSYADPARSGFANLQFADGEDTGIALDYAFSSTNSVGVVFSNYSEASSNKVGLNSSDVDFESEAVSMYLSGETAGINWRSLASFSDDTHTMRERNAFATSSDKASFSGETMRFAQQISKPVRLGGGWLTPWANLSYSEQKVDGFTMSNALVSDLKYSDATVTESKMAIGLNAQLDPLAINRDSAVTFSAGLGYERSLHRDDYEVKIKETGTGLTSTQTIENEELESMTFSLGADMKVGEALSLTTDYLLTKPVGYDADHSLMLNLRYRF